MSRLQSFKRIITEDFKEKDRDLISKLAYSINTFADDVLNAFEKKISLFDNLSASQVPVRVVVNGAGIPTQATIITTGLGAQCAGAQVIKAVNTTNSAHFPSTAPFLSFTNVSNSAIKISNVTGLQTNEVYVLTVIFWPAT